MEIELIVHNNLKATLNRFLQWRTYSGLIEGMPVERINNGILKRAMNEAQDFNTHNPVHLIEPTLTPIPYEDSYAFGKPVSLPQIICIADLVHYGPANSSGDYSGLTVVWLQENYAF